MTYHDFLTKTYKRPIYKNYYIDNKGKVYSAYTNKVLKETDGRVYLSINGKTKKIVVWLELIKAFPDVELPERLKNQYNKKYRGAYPYPHGKKNWRAVAKFFGTYKTIGYYKTKKEAASAYYYAYLLVRGYRPW